MKGVMLVWKGARVFEMGAKRIRHTVLRGKLKIRIGREPD